MLQERSHVNYVWQKMRQDLPTRDVATNYIEVVTCDYEYSMHIILMRRHDFLASAFFEHNFDERNAATSNFTGFFEKGSPLDVKIIAYFEVPKSYTKKRRINCLAGLELPTKKPDIDNIAKIVMDGMNPKTRRNKQLHKLVKVMRGVYQDDQQVTYLTVKKRYAERARVEVRVKEDEGR